MSARPRILDASERAAWRAERRWTRRGVRSRDLIPTVFTLAAWTVGLVLLVALLVVAQLPAWWAWVWLTAVAALILGSLVGAPVLSGRVLATVVLVAMVLAGGSMVRIGIDHLFEVEQVAARDTASLLAYAVRDDDGTDPESVLAVRTDATTDVGKLCTDAAGTWDVGRNPACQGPEDRSDGDAGPGVEVADQAEGAAAAARTTRELTNLRTRATLAVAELELARARAEEAAASQPGAPAGAADAAIARVAAARTSRSEARAAFVATTTPRRTDVAAAMSAGVGDLVDRTLPAEAPLPLAPGLVVWSLTGAAILGLVRWTAVRNATRGLGPVAIEEPPESDDWAPCRERFRIHLLENVPEPGATPSSESVTKVAELVGTAVPTAKAGSQLVANVVEALHRLVVVERGYAVQVAIVQRADGDGRLVVRVRQARTRALMEQREFPYAADERDVVVREAALWAAAVIVAASRSVPTWARWTADAARPLAEVRAAQDQAGGSLVASDDGFRTVGEPYLRAALLRSPSSGRLLLELAHAEELDGRLVAALARSLEAVGHHPRFLNARYRLASEAGLLATTVRGLAPLDLRSVAADLLPAVTRHLGDTHPLCEAVSDAFDAPGPPTRARLAEQLYRFSLRQRAVERWYRAPAVLLVEAVRATERDLWLTTLRQRRRRTDLQDRVASAKLVAWGQHEPERRRDARIRRRRWLARRAEHTDVVWQVPYNLACYHASVGGLERPDPDDLVAARRWLERARLARDGHQLTREWAAIDPDLLAIRTHDLAWWEAFLARCPSEAVTPSSSSTRAATSSGGSDAAGPVEVEYRHTEETVDRVTVDRVTVDRTPT